MLPEELRAQLRAVAEEAVEEITVLVRAVWDQVAEWQWREMPREDGFRHYYVIKQSCRFILQKFLLQDLWQLDDKGLDQLGLCATRAAAPEFLETHNENMRTLVRVENALRSVRKKERTPEFVKMQGTLEAEKIAAERSLQQGRTWLRKNEPQWDFVRPIVRVRAAVAETLAVRGLFFPARPGGREVSEEEFSKLLSTMKINFLVMDKDSPERIQHWDGRVRPEISFSYTYPPKGVTAEALQKRVLENPSDLAENLKTLFVYGRSG